MDKFLELDISYSAIELPPPFAHHFQIYVSNAKSHVEVKLVIKYIGREGLTENEIKEEGFTLDDDFAWEGKIGKAWIDSLNTLIGQTSMVSGISYENMELKILIPENRFLKGHPQNNEDWKYLIQEIAQASLESAELEAPLTLRYKNIETASSRSVELTASFKERIATVRIMPYNEEKNYKWEELKVLLEQLYIPEYLSENSTEKEPKKSGSYIDPGEGYWYKFGDGVRNTSKKRDDLSELKKLFEKV